MKKNVVLYNNFQEPKLGGRKIEDLEILVVVWYCGCG